MDKAAVVLRVDKWRPDGVSHAQNDIYLKTTSLALVDQENLNSDLTTNVATSRSTQQELSWNKKVFFIQKEITFNVIPRFALWKNVYQGEQ